jgi:DNA-binding cell septation regulator SpoVG
LARKLIVAIAERDRQVAEFEEISRTLAKDLRKKWEGQIDAWVADKTQPTPYRVVGKSGMCIVVEEEETADGTFRRPE